MNYEIEGKLRDKANSWELRNVENENQRLKAEIIELQRQIGDLQSVIRNRFYALDNLFNLLAEHPSFTDISNQIYELKSNL